MEIYWIENKKQCGPISVPDVISKLEAGELTGETKSWHSGCESWRPLRELPALTFYFDRREKEDSLAKETEADKGRTAQFSVQVITSPTPMMRFMARMVDCALYMLFAFGLLRVMQLPFHALYFSPLFWLPLYFAEGWLLHVFGTTPGKKLFGIEVSLLDGSRLSVGQGISRSLQLFFFGMGFMYSVLPPVLMAVSWYHLRSRGLTIWDARLKVFPKVMSPCGSERIIVAVSVIFCCLYMSGMLLQAWMPDMLTWLQGVAQSEGTRIPAWMENLLQSGKPQ